VELLTTTNPPARISLRKWKARTISETLMDQILIAAQNG
jgi:hypothetical protein